MTPTTPDTDSSKLSLLTPEEVEFARQQGRPLVVVPGYGVTKARSRFIASCHYKDKFHTYNHNSIVTFTLDAPQQRPKLSSECSVVEVFDTQQWIRDTSDPEQESGFAPAPIPCEIIVDDLIREWTAGYVGRTAKTRPGIMPIAGSVPTKEEFSQMSKWEDRHCRAKVEEADAIHFATQSGTPLTGVLKRITDDHRKALLWLGSERRPWYKPVEAGFTKKGAASGQLIPMEALFDNGVDLIQLYATHDLDPLKFGDHFIHNLLQERKGIKDIGKLQGMIEKRPAQPV